MTLIALKKVTLCGLLSEKAAILDRLQDLGCLHLVALRPPPAEPEKATPRRAEDSYRALRFLMNMPNKRRQISRDPKFDIRDVTRAALDIQQRLREQSDRRDFLEQRIKGLEPWGDLFFPPHEALAHHRLWFYVLPSGKARLLNDLDMPWQVVHRDPRRTYVVLIAREEPPSDILPVARTHTGALPLNELRLQLEECESEIESLTADRQALTRYIYLMSVHMAEAEDASARAFAGEQTLDADGIVAIQGWAPAERAGALQEFARHHDLACLIEEPGPDDDPPTLLENPPELAAGTDLSLFYQVPGYRTWDPSIILLFSFALFFAMIVADAGYALFMLLLLGLFWNKLGRTPVGKRYRSFGLIVLGVALVYGIVAGGYFGITLPPGSLLDRIDLIDMNDVESMMRLSIIIGAFHLVLANGVVAYHNRRHPTALARLGWIAAIIGGLGLWLADGGSPLETAAGALLGAGLLTVFLFSSQRPIDRPASVARRGIDGLLALTKVSGMFGDVLSYMRLFALGLSSTSLALTFNQLAVQVHDAVPGIGLLFSLLILLLGHTMNLGLSVMSGVVHGLRLNFMEFYNWGMPEEGHTFEAFARTKVSHE